jgi:Domain of unknown function (DUF4145)
VSERCHCNDCGRETNHNIKWSDDHQGPDEDGLSAQQITRELLECAGCGELVLRHSSLRVSPDEPPAILDQTFQPPRLWRSPPDWLGTIAASDPDLHGLMCEVYSCANDAQVRSLSMGIRAVLDRLMFRMLADNDIGSFDAKLTELVKRGHLAQHQKELLAVVIDAGSASSHRGYRPPSRPAGRNALGNRGNDPPALRHESNVSDS